MFYRHFRKILSISLAAVIVLLLSSTSAGSVKQVKASGPTASQLLALLNSCSQISNGLYRTDSETAATIPICKLNGAVYWKADMDIDCDGKTTSVCNSTTDPWYQNDTSAHTSTGEPLTASSLPYVVIPSSSGTWNYNNYNIQLGAVVAVIYNGQVSYGIFGDTGPTAIIGESSYAMAQSLGIDPNPATGGVDSGVSYIVFQGSNVSPIEDHTKAVSIGESLANQLISNNGGPTATNTPKPTITNTPIPNGNGNPYSGMAVSLPGTIQAENFNTGGEGVAYHDADTTNQGNQYRTSEGVDIEPSTDTNAGYNVGWTAAGEWLKYTVNVTASGTYNFAFRVASAQTGGTFHLEVDGVNVTGTLTVPNTGGWQTWTTVNKTGVSLSVGTRIFRLVTDSAGGNYNWLSVSSATTVTNTPKPTNTNTPKPTATCACGVTPTPTFAPPTNTPVQPTATKVTPTATQSTTAPAWDGNSHPYNVGDLVSYQGHIYRCQQAHTSLPTWDPVSAPSLWVFVS